MAAQSAPQNSAYWHSKADEARAKADAMQHPEAAHFLLQVARIYDLMASQAAKHEQLANLSSASGVRH